MNEEAISYIMQKMSNCLDNNQMIRLEKTLEEALRGEDIVSLKSSEELLEEFVPAPLKSQAISAFSAFLTFKILCLSAFHEIISFIRLCLCTN